MIGLNTKSMIPGYITIIIIIIIIKSSDFTIKSSDNFVTPAVKMLLVIKHLCPVSELTIDNKHSTGITSRISTPSCQCLVNFDFW